jgi:hypothetical protein
MAVLVATVATEGGFYSAVKDNRSPIRIYSDRCVYDDFIVKSNGTSRRERLTKKEYRRILKAAKGNI